MPKMVDLYGFKFGSKLSLQTGYILFGNHSCRQIVKTFFERTIQGGLSKTVFDEVYPAPGKAYDKDNPCRNNQHSRRKRRKILYNIGQNIPASHILTVNNKHGFVNTNLSVKFLRGESRRIGRSSLLKSS
jgi:hypothetical protein